MPRAAADAISKFLDSFGPKSFSSDAEAQSWIHNESRKNRLGTNAGSAITNFVKGFSNVNNNLRTGKADPQAAQMLKGAAPLPNDLILTKTVEPSAFGLDPAHIANVEELTGKLIHDPGFTSANIGTPNPPTGPGPHIQMTIATPAGTKAIIPQVSSPTSEVVLTPDQNIRVTKVTPDGKGGYYMMAVATPGGTPKEKSTPLHEAPPAPAPLNLPPKPGEQPATPGSAPAAPESPAQTPIPSAPSATAPAAAPAAGPATPSNAPSAPRTEPNVVEALTPGGTPTPAVQPTATPGTPEAPAAPGVPAIPEAPAAPVDFRQAVKDADLPIPTAGKRRQQWNSAYLGLTSNKKHPEDALRELRADIEHNKGTLADDVKTNTDSGPLPNDIKAQEALANLIEEKYGLGKPKEPQTPEEHRNAAQELLSTPTSDLNAARQQRLKAEGHIRQADQAEKGQKAVARRGPKLISKEEMPNKAAIRKEARARTPAPTAREKARAEEAKALGIKSSEEAAAKNAASDTAAKKISDPWLERAGIKESDLTDHERVGVALMADSVARKKISRPEAARRLRQEGEPDSKLSRIADAISPAPAKAVPSAKAAEGAAPEAKIAKGNLPETATILQLRQIAKDRGIRIPSKVTRKDEIRKLVEEGGTPGAPSKPSVEDRVATLLLDKIKQNDPKIADEIMQGMSPADRKGVEEAVARVKGAEAVTKIGANEGIPEKATIAQLRQIAKDRGVKIPSKLTRKDDIRRHIEGESHLERATVGRQKNIDQARNLGEIASELDHLVANDATPAAMKSRVNNWAKRTNASDSDRDRLLKAVETGDKSQIDAELTRFRRSAGISVVGGKRGETVPFNPKHHEAPGGGVKAGDKVFVSRTGHEATLPGGEKVHLGKATVEPVGAGKGDIPKGSDIETAIGHLDPGVVRSRKRIIDDVRKDLAENKKTPAQIGRDLDRTVSSIENSAAIRYGGHIGNPSDERKAELKVKLDQDRHDAAELKRLADHLKASRRAPEPKLSTETTPAKKAAAVAQKATPAKKAITKIEAPEALKQAVAKTSIADLRKQAADEGIKVPASARTKQQIMDHIVQEMAKRGAAHATQPKTSIQDDIKKAYAAVLAHQDKGKGDWVSLADLRDELGDKHRRTDIDKALVDYARHGQDEGVRVIPLANRKALNERDHMAELKVGGGEPSHMINFKDVAPARSAPAKAPAAKVATPAQKQEVIDRMRAKATPAKAAKKAEPAVEAPSARSIASRRIAEQAQAQQAAKAERTGVQAGKFSDKPILENNWGTSSGEVNFHPDGAIGQALDRMGEDKKLDVNGEPLANVVGKLATDGVRGKLHAEQVRQQLKELAQKLPEGRGKKALEGAVEALDAPVRSVQIPPHVPDAVKDLSHAFETIPLARRRESEGRRSRSEPVLDRLAKIMDEYSKGRLRGRDLIRQIEDLQQADHESQEGRFDIIRAVDHALSRLNKIGWKGLNPPPGGWPKRED